jgi:hypothetical protein
VPRAKHAGRIGPNRDVGVNAIAPTAPAASLRRDFARATASRGVGFGRRGAPADEVEFNGTDN